MDSKQIILKYQDKSKYDLCCSESILYAANEYYNLNLSRDVIKASGAFCGGSFLEKECGLLIAGKMVISIMTYEEVAHQSEKMQELIKQYAVEFGAKFSSSSCEKLKGLYRDETIGCKNLVVEAFEHLVHFIKQNV